MSVDKRARLLLAAYHSMPKIHRPEDATIALRANPSILPQDILFVSTVYSLVFRSDAGMIPYINMGDLLEPATLLTFLNFRGRKSSSTFAHSEFLHCPLAECEDEVLCRHLVNSTKVFMGQQTQSSYGYIKVWDNSKDARQSTSKGQGLHPAHDLQVVRFQRLIYTFQQRCCHLLVGDILEHEKVNLDLNSIPQQRSALPQSTINYASRAKTSLLAPFFPPAQFNFKRLRTVITSKIGERNDHIWTLREDPSYFGDVSEDQKNHARAEFVTFAAGRPTPAVRKQRNILNLQMIHKLVLQPHYSLFHWREYLRLLDSLETVVLHYNFDFAIDQPLPVDYHENILRL
jgi:hypothetical protein